MTGPEGRYPIDPKNGRPAASLLFNILLLKDLEGLEKGRKGALGRVTIGRNREIMGEAQTPR
jgi:hypothetical protein